MATTPSGGNHFYFHDFGMENTASLIPNVDSRGNGGLIVAPPSPGLVADADDNTCAVGKYEWVQESLQQELTTPDLWLMDLYARKARAEAVKPKLSKGAYLQRFKRMEVASDAYKAKTVENVQNEVASALKKTRNNKLYKRAARLMDPDIGMTESEVFSVLIDAAEHSGLDEAEIRDAVANAAVYRNKAKRGN